MKNTRLLSITLLVAVITSVLGIAPVFAANPVLTINISNHVQGDTFDIPIMVDTGGTGIRGYQFNLNFDPTRLTVNSVSDGGFLQTADASCPPPISPVPPTINNVTGRITGAGWALLGCAGSTANGLGTLVRINVTVKAAAPNGRANFSFFDNGSFTTKLVDVNSAAVPGLIFNARWVQVGPGPNLVVASIGFTPHGTGQTFDVAITVTNNGGSASDPDTLNVTLTNATPGTATFPVPSLPATTGSQTFTMTNVTLTGTNSVVTATLAVVGGSRSATYSPVSDSGTTPVDSSFGAFLRITAPAAVNFGNMVLGANTQTGILNVKCNTNYQVDVTSDKTFFGTPWSGTLYVAGPHLVNAIHVQSGAAGGSHDVTNGTPPALITGAGPAGQVGDTGQNFSLNFVQTLTYADPLLPAGQTYHQVLTFNAFVTL